MLFLDIDGVLNSEMWYRKRPKGNWTEAREFDPEAVWLLKAVVAMSGCEIVVSSSWRIGRTLEELKAIPALSSFPIIGKTPQTSLKDNGRGAEVDMWLKEHCESPRRNAIVDDGGDFYEHQNLVRTDWKLGLTPWHCEELVRLLTTDNPVDQSKGGE